MTDREKALAYFRHREAQIPMPGARAMYQEAIKALEQPEITYCRDCKYHRYEHDKTGDIPYCSNADYGYGWKDNDFCSKGERRTDERMDV